MDKRIRRDLAHLADEGMIGQTTYITDEAILFTVIPSVMLVESANKLHTLLLEIGYTLSPREHLTPDIVTYTRNHPYGDAQVQYAVQTITGCLQ